MATATSRLTHYADGTPMRFPLAREDGVWKHAITCGECGIRAYGPAAALGGVHPRNLETGFSQRGWLVGQKAKADTCPSCVRKRQSEQAEAESRRDTALSAALVAAAETKIAQAQITQMAQPPKMTRASPGKRHEDVLEYLRQSQKAMRITQIAEGIDATIKATTAALHMLCKSGAVRRLDRGWYVLGSGQSAIVPTTLKRRQFRRGHRGLMILNLLEAKGPMYPSDMARELGCSVSAVLQSALRLAHAGKIAREEYGRYSRYEMSKPLPPQAPPIPPPLPLLPAAPATPSGEYVFVRGDGPSESLVVKELDVRQPTVADRRRIMDALDVVYDPEAGKYRKDGSDKALAERLDVPRVWVSQIRADFFGAEDRNEVGDKRAQELFRLTSAVNTLGIELATALEKLASIDQRVSALKKEIEALSE